jgi:hypothetical protein
MTIRIGRFGHGPVCAAARPVVPASSSAKAPREDGGAAGEEGR